MNDLMDSVCTLPNYGKVFNGFKTKLNGFNPKFNGLKTNFLTNFTLENGKGKSIYKSIYNSFAKPSGKAGFKNLNEIACYIVRGPVVPHIPQQGLTQVFPMQWSSEYHYRFELCWGPASNNIRSLVW